MKQKIIAILIVFMSLFALLPYQTVGAAQNACDYMQGNAGNSSVCGNKSNSDLKTTAKNIINVLFWVIGIAAVIVIIYSGILYIISAGNSNTVQKAKTTLTYAVVGLIVAILSYAIVSFVVNALKK